MPPKCKRFCISTSTRSRNWFLRLQKSGTNAYPSESSIYCPSQDWRQGEEKVRQNSISCSFSLRWISFTGEKHFAAEVVEESDGCQNYVKTSLYSSAFLFFFHPFLGKINLLHTFWNRNGFKVNQKQIYGGNFIRKHSFTVTGEFIGAVFSSSQSITPIIWYDTEKASDKLNARIVLV